jgi:Uma2 family endonuclease
MAQRQDIRRRPRSDRGKRPGNWTFHDFYEVLAEDEKADLIDGVIYMASPESWDNNHLFLWLAGLLGDYVAAKKLGEVVGSRVAFRLDDKGGPEPDVAFVRNARRNLVRNGYFDGPPDLAIEIVSPESVERDYEDKYTLYQSAGVTEYWIVDEYLNRITVYRLDQRGKYREVRPRGGEYHSQVIPGFRLRPEWLWKETRPAKAEILAELLR